MKTFRHLLILLFLLGSGVSFAQNAKKDEVEAMKSAFITRRLDLSTEQARAFWPVYDQYQDDLESLRRKRREEVRSAKQDFENLSEKELEKIVDNEIAFRQAELDVLKKYHPQFKQLLSVRKVALLYKAEEEFKRELLKRLREGRR
jgi:Skp family chaperone for outer membrane proteins